MIFLSLQRTTARFSMLSYHARAASTLHNHSYIYVFPDKKSIPPFYILSLLPSDPPTASLAIGTTTTIPPIPESFKETPEFTNILHSVLKRFAHRDPGLISQAKAFASTGGSSLGSGGGFFPQQPRSGRRHSSGGGGAGGDGAGGASAQGGAGGGGRGGWVHLSDSRNPPDYGRIAWPEDIFGSLQVDSQGNFIGETGEYQPSGTYRIVTRDGVLGLSDFLIGKLVEALQEREKSVRK